ncbi:hypothetical protein SETIT_3G127500v2 [Setaria italica]|uniref:Reverse transcriptase zinc-binding domain-containing protein n=2 Tax=Setaria TaxID=4554 RepID=A0A368QE95_SETIT|nr:hypothetical protein SETIT_3G127500v2 [Setaria italica]TKW25602.1 hypothetical protein SEVIR_3G129900v2 [Setaria viridis]
MKLQSYSCALRTQNVEESLHHLHLHCPFSQQCWGILNLHVSTNDHAFQVLEHFKKQIHQSPTVQACKAAFKAENHTFVIAREQEIQLFLYKPFRWSNMTK